MVKHHNNSSTKLKYHNISFINNMDSFHNYLKKQLLEYVEAERKKGIPLEEIEKVLTDAGHKKNIVDEVFLELEKEKAGGKETKHKDPVENDLVGQLKNAFSQFMGKASEKEVKEAQKDLEKTDTKELVQEVIEEAEIIEEKTMFESLAFFIYLLALGLIILFATGGTESQIVNVVFGFSPAIISVFASFLSLKLADNVPLYMFIPLGITSVFYAIGKFANIGLFKGLDIEALAIVNFLAGFFFNVLIVYVRFLKPNSMIRKVIKPEIKKKTPTKEKTKAISDLKKEFNI